MASEVLLMRKVLERLERRGGQWLGGLPENAKRALSRKPPVVLDGQTLDPDMQLALGFLALVGAPDLTSASVVESRARMRRQTRVHSIQIAVGGVRDFSIPGPGGAIPVRHYSPSEPGGPHPLLVYLHGGGFVLGDLDTHDDVCRALSTHAGLHVLAVDYRLAPEHPFPAGLDDACAALAWAHANAAALGAHPGRLAIGGDSAGGNLSTVACQLAAEAGGPQAVLQLLLYPSTDRTRPYRSQTLFAAGFLLTKADLDWFHERYARPDDLQDRRISPLLGRHGGLPRALVVTAGFDPLRDEGEAYAAALMAAGTPTVLRRFPSFVHGFANMLGPSKAAADAVREIAGAVRALTRI